MTSAEWICRIDQNNIEVARELEVLKTVVENKTFNAAAFEFPALRKTTRPNTDFDSISDAFVEESGLVVPAFRNLHPIGEVGTLRQRAITAREHASFFSTGVKALREPNNQGSFPRAPNGEVADTDDDATQTALMDNACAISPRTQARTRGVEKRKRPQKRFGESHALPRGDCEKPSRSSAMRASVRAVAPRFASTRARALRPISALREGSRIKSTHTLPSCAAFAT